MHASPRSFPVRSQLIRSGSAPVLWCTDNPRARQARAGSTAGQRRSAGTFESSSSPGSVKRGRKRGARYPDRRATRPLDQDFAVSPRICDGGRTTCGLPYLRDQLVRALKMRTCSLNFLVLVSSSSTAAESFFACMALNVIVPAPAADLDFVSSSRHAWNALTSSL